MVTLEQLEQLRREWLDLQKVAVDAATGYAYASGAVAVANVIGTGGSANECTAQIAAAEAAQRAKWLEYQDALTRFQAQESSRQVDASNRLGSTNKNLTWAITGAAVVQALAAIAQAFYAAKGSH